MNPTNTLEIERLLKRIESHARAAFWNADGLRALRADVKAAPSALADSSSVLGMRAAISLFYRIPEWVMVPGIYAAWIASTLLRRDA